MDANVDSVTVTGADGSFVQIANDGTVYVIANDGSGNEAAVDIEPYEADALANALIALARN